MKNFTKNSFGFQKYILVIYFTNITIEIFLNLKIFMKRMNYVAVGELFREAFFSKFINNIIFNGLKYVIYNLITIVYRKVNLFDDHQTFL